MEVTTWTTKEGKTLLITDMEDSHLKNTIRYLRRHAERIKDSLEFEMLCYAVHAPEMAADDCENAAQRLAEMLPDEYLANDETYVALIKEARKRKLDMPEEFKSFDDYHEPRNDTTFDDEEIPI